MSMSNRLLLGIGIALLGCTLLAILSQEADGTSRDLEDHPQTEPQYEGTEDIGLARDSAPRERLIPEADPGLADPRWEVQVRSAADGAAVEGAAIFFGLGASEQFVGESDETGTAFFFRTDSGYLWVKHPGFAPSRSWIPSDSSSPIMVTLREGASISGVVESAGHRLPLGQVSVLAWDSERPPSFQDWSRWRAGLPNPFFEGKVDLAGGFMISGLSDARSYSLLAGGPGLISLPVQFRVKAGDHTVRLPLRQIYGCRLEVRDQSGKAIDAAPSTMAYSFSWSAYAVPGEPILAADRRLLLAGIEGPTTEGQGSPLSPYIFMLGDSEGVAHAPGPIECKFDVLGYRRVSATIDLQPIETSTPVHSVQLASTSSEFAEVTFVFHGSTASLPPGTTGPVGYLLLNGQSGWQYEFEVSDFSRPLVIQGIPQSYFSYELRLTHRFKSVTPGNSSGLSGVVQVDQTHQEVSLDTSDLGGVKLIIANSDGSMFDGQADFSIHSQSNQATYPFTFSGAPFVISGLPTGSYSLSYRTFSEGREPEVVSSQPFMVSGGDMTEVSIDLVHSDTRLF